MTSKVISDYIGHDNRAYADWLNQRREAEQRVIVAARKLLKRVELSFNEPPTVDGDTVMALANTVIALDALHPPAALDETRELPAVEPELPPRVVRKPINTVTAGSEPGSYKRARGMLGEEACDA